MGKTITVERLAEIFLELQGKGAHNLNLVTAGHFVPQVIEALDMAKERGLSLPVVYNTGAYEEVDTLRLLEGYVDIYLPDLKYVDAGLSEKYSHAPDYFHKARAAITEMVRQVGEPRMTEEAPQLMTKGVIVRHLLLPGCTRDSMRVLDYLLSEYKDCIYISLMNQYTPLPHVSAYPELQRKVTKREYEKVINYALKLGMEKGFIQEGDTAKESFIPAFDESGV